jgi:hypothetical protein|tara:strand:+ start:235 stop:525 length:291 start_codon:yes stop_codon:yes gene_type:complete
MKTLVIKRDKTKYNKKYFEMKIVKKFNTIYEATEYLLRYMPNGRFDGLNVSGCEIKNTIECLWYDLLDKDTLDNHTLKITNPTKILERVKQLKERA